MDIYVTFLDVDTGVNGKFHIHGNSGNYSSQTGYIGKK